MKGHLALMIFLMAYLASCSMFQNQTALFAKINKLCHHSLLKDRSENLLAVKVQTITMCIPDRITTLALLLCARSGAHLLKLDMYPSFLNVVPFLNSSLSGGLEA